MKGMAIHILSITLSFLFIGVIVYNFVILPDLRTGETENIHIQAQTFSAFHALDAAEITANTALTFSLGQACFDTLYVGGGTGFTGSPLVWWNQELKAPSQQTILAVITEKAELNMKSYTGRINRFFSFTYILPEFDVEAPDTTGTITAIARQATGIGEAPSSDLVFQVSKTFSFERVLPAGCFSLIEAGSQLASSLGPTTKTGIDLWEPDPTLTIPEGGTITIDLGTDLPTNQRDLASLFTENQYSKSLSEIEETLTSDLQASLLLIVEGIDTAILPGIETHITLEHATVKLLPSCSSSIQAGTAELTCDFVLQPTAEFLVTSTLLSGERVPVKKGSTIKEAPLELRFLIRHTEPLS
ncbi:MAG: hypothetical protein KKA90_02040 [Nanoarchaeota archaeon]|nr:hypothetical protein [Nanoarchaeota archaeon]